VGPNFQKPVVNAPEKYRFDYSGEDSAAIMEWWTLFHDPVLDSLISTAIRENRDVKVAASRIEEARYSVKYNAADMWPRFGYEGNLTWGNLNPILSSGSTGSVGNYYAAPYLSWEIDIWGKYRRATESARDEMFASEFAHRGIIISLISEVAKNYFELLDFQNRLEITRNTLKTRQAYLNVMQERYNKGVIAEIDLNQAQIQEAIAAAAIPQYERLVAQSEHILSILLGKNPGPIALQYTLSQQTIPPDIPPGLPSTLVERRPDIMEAEYMVAAQNARIGIAQAMRFPSFSLTGLFGAASPDLTLSAASAAWSVSGSLLGPIFNFGKNKARVEVERKRTEQAYLMYDQSVLNAFREVEDALTGVSTYDDQYLAVERQRIAAANAAMLSRARYDEGLTSYLEVLDSERTLFDADLNASQVFQLWLNSYVYLYKSLGGGWISEEEKKAAEEAAKAQAEQQQAGK
jgi:multidrug efflux system outer membrane protein